MRGMMPEIGLVATVTWGGLPIAIAVVVVAHWLLPRVVLPRLLRRPRPLGPGGAEAMGPDHSGRTGHLRRARAAARRAATRVGDVGDRVRGGDGDPLRADRPLTTRSGSRVTESSSNRLNVR